MKLIVALLVMIVAALVPATVNAGSTAVVTITAQPWSVGDCPTGFTINAVSPYEIQMTWTNGGNMTNAVLRGAYGRWPGNATDGFEVYTGTGNSTTHWVNTEFIGVDVYYRLWGEIGGNYSFCYASGTVQGGEGMNVIGLSFLGGIALLAMIGGFGLRQTPLLVVAMLLWLGEAGYAGSQAEDAYDIYGIMTGVSFFAALVSILGLFMIRERPEPTENEMMGWREEEKTQGFAEWQKSKGLRNIRKERREREIIV